MFLVIYMNDSNIEKKINLILDKIRPFLLNDGGNLEFIKFEDGIVYVHLSGACEECSMLDFTLKDGIEQLLINEIPEVTEVKNLNVL